MCNLDIFYGLIIAAQASVIVAMVAIGAAAALNAGLFTVGGAPVAMTTASIALGAAIATLAGAGAALYDYWSCVGSPEECSAIFVSLESALAGLIADLAVALVTCLGLIGVMAAPFVGAAAALAFLGVLGIYIAVFGTAIYLIDELLSCVETAATSSPLAEAVPVIFFYLTIPVAVLAAALVWRNRSNNKVSSGNNEPQ